ncbi:MAG: glycoside hydrolase family 15 protein [Actinomycetota bacterium]|nr:glycoside hydrolase family 15 protein [Actinomycetota bacterium]
MSADADLYRVSVEVMARGQHRSGAFVASPTFPTYRYSWIRDGSFIAAALDEAGDHERAGAFHRWVAGVVERYRPRIERVEANAPLELTDRDILHTRFTLEGEEGSEWWANFQLDGYGYWLSALARHLRRAGRGDEFLPAVGLAARYLAMLWERPCYDCWEEFPDRAHPATLAAVAGGLRHAAALLDDAGPGALAQRILDRVMARGTTEAADGDGNMPEQVSRHLLKPDRFQPWVERWGPVATPLLWSHAMYVLARGAVA